MIPNHKQFGLIYYCTNILPNVFITWEFFYWYGPIFFKYKNEQYLWTKSTMSTELCLSHKKMNNVMERYYRDSNNLFHSQNHGFFVFCERVEGHSGEGIDSWGCIEGGLFTNWQGRKGVQGWWLKKRRDTKSAWSLLDNGKFLSIVCGDC